MLLRQLFEAIAKTGDSKTAVVGWGRGMGHKGHMMLASSVITKAKAVGGDPYFVVSRTVGADDPITPDEKLAIYKKVFPQHGHIFQAASDELPDLTKVLANLNQQGYANAVVVVGADQVKAFQYLHNYNGKPNKAGEIPFKFDNLEVISRQETGDPSAGEEGPRATPMRDILKDPNATPDQQFKVWRDAMSPEVSDDEVKDLMAKAKDRMAQFSAPKPKKAKGVAEGFSDIVKGVKRKVAGKTDPKEVEHMYGRIARSAIKHKTPDQAEKDIERYKKVSKVVNKEGVAEKMLPKSAFAGSDKNKLGPAAHLKGKMKRPARQGDLVGGMEESKLVPINESIAEIYANALYKVLLNEVK